MVMVFDGEIAGLLTTFQKARGTSAHGDNNSESDDAMIYTFLSRNNVQKIHRRCQRQSQIYTRNRKHRPAAAKPAACAKPIMLSTVASKGKTEEG